MSDIDFCLFCKRPMNEKEIDVNHLIVKLDRALNTPADPVPAGVHNLPGQIEVIKSEIRSMMAFAKKVVRLTKSTERRIDRCIESAIPPDR